MLITRNLCVFGYVETEGASDRTMGGGIQSMQIDTYEAARIGEEDLNAWFKANGLCYVSVCQTRETFAPLFSNNLKRPDFLVLLDSLGLIAVDAKNKKPSQGELTLELEDELRRAVAFERVFRMPVWYAYRVELDGKVVWHWINALKAIEVGKERTNKDNNKPFLAIKLEDFEHIESNDDLGKLYTCRMPGLRKVKEISA